MRSLPSALLFVLVGACIAAPAALANRRAHTGASATNCTFTGARWTADGRTGKEYDMTVLRRVDCSEASAVARGLTKKRSRGPNTRFAARGGWFCLSFAPRDENVSRGGCAKLGKALMWAPRGGRSVGGEAGKDKPQTRDEGGEHGKGRDQGPGKRGKD